MCEVQKSDGNILAVVTTCLTSSGGLQETVPQLSCSGLKLGKIRMRHDRPTSAYIPGLSEPASDTGETTFTIGAWRMGEDWRVGHDALRCLVTYMT